ncbi:MAG: hypothetical protein Kow00103_09160 [Candidatus Caldatribacteriota bacterium]
MKDKYQIQKVMFFLFLTLLGFGFFNLPISAQAQIWDSCPFGLEDDPYPGECGRYIDTNNDGICDLSQSEPQVTEDVLDKGKVEQSTKLDISSTSSISEEEYSVEISGSKLKNLTIQEIAQLWEIEAEELLSRLKKDLLLTQDYTIENTIEDLRNEMRFSPSVVKRVAEDLKKQSDRLAEETIIQEDKENINNQEDIDQVISNEVQDKSVKQKIITDYNFIEIALITLLAYLFGKWISAKLKIKSAREKKFWNRLLLASFIGSAGTGFILVFIRDFAWFRAINFDFLYWHVEFSIVMGFIGIFHALWHIKYYLK